MNNYIIDPKVFYWMNVFGILQTVFAVIGVLMTAGGIGCLITYFYYKYGNPYFSDKNDLIRMIKLFKNYTKFLLIPGVLFIIVAIFIPGKATSVEMLIAKTATFENTELTVKGIKEVVNYIVTAIKSVV